MNELAQDFGLARDALGHLTSAVQFGFIVGTLGFAILTVADRFQPSKVFLLSAIAGAGFNLGLIAGFNELGSLLAFRFLTGFFLAGIYPVGMKIASDYYREGLGKSLGYLVGALVLGTAFPHFFRGLTDSLPWKYILIGISGLAIIGGLLMALFIPDGPYREPGSTLKMSAFIKVFGNPRLRSAAVGYFGHMWELYAFWAFVPVMLATYNGLHPEALINIPLWSFAIIGIGGISCVMGGYLSLNFGTKKVALMALALSGLCCLLSPVFFLTELSWLFIIFLLLWGMVVIADSPLFSTLVARNARPEHRGTALTIVNCIGFALTIVSIQLVNLLWNMINPTYIYVMLGLGPVLGLISLNINGKVGTKKQK